MNSRVLFLAGGLWWVAAAQELGPDEDLGAMANAVREILENPDVNEELRAPELVAPESILPPQGVLPEAGRSQRANGEPDELAPLASLPEYVTMRSGPGGKIDLNWGAGNRGLRITGQVQVTGDNGLQIFANEGVWEEAKKRIVVSGDVSVYQGNVLQKGEKATYYYEEGRVDSSGLRGSLDPIILEAGRFQSEVVDGRRIFFGENAGVTTHDVENPNYWLRAERTTVIPDDRVIFEKLKLYVGETPILYLPYLSQSLNTDLGWQVVPGARTHLGFFLKGRYGVMLGGDKNDLTGLEDDGRFLAQYRAELFSKRGLGLGLDLYEADEGRVPAVGGLKMFYLNDLDPAFSRSGIRRGFVNEDRFRLDLEDRRTLWDMVDGEVELTTNLTFLSDRYFLEDFDTRALRNDPEPDNSISLSRRTDRSLANLLIRMRPNNFYQSEIRFPELSYDWIRQPLAGGPWLYESQSSFGFMREFLDRRRQLRLRQLREDFADDESIQNTVGFLLNDRGFARFHTHHEFSRPLKMGPFNVVPRVGGGYTGYTAVEGPADGTDRAHFSAGTEASLKFSKVYPEIGSSRWGLDRLLHVTEPYVNLSYVSTNQLERVFPAIDRLTSSTRPRPLTLGRFTAIDDYAGWTIARLGVRNRLMTKRDGETHTWFAMDTYLDAFVEDPEFDRNISNLYNEIQWTPVPWLDLGLETQFPVVAGGSEFSEVVVSGRVMPHDDLEVALHFRLLDNHPILRDSSRLELDTFYRLTSRWGLGSSHIMEMADGRLELQEYNLHYNTGSWLTSVGIYQRDNIGREDYGFQVGFSLQEFPSSNLPVRFGAD